MFHGVLVSSGFQFWCIRHTARANHFSIERDHIQCRIGSWLARGACFARHCPDYVSIRLRAGCEKCPNEQEQGRQASGPSARIVRGPDASAHYPQKAFDRSVTGTVRVRIVYDEGGCVVTASVDRSSGSDLLDQAAVAAAFDTVIAPALKDGVDTAGVGVIPLNFDIEIE